MLQRMGRITSLDMHVPASTAALLDMCAILLVDGFACMSCYAARHRANTSAW